MARRSDARRLDTGSMKELRRLVCGDDERRVAEALPRAVTLRSQRDRNLTVAIQPLLVDALRDVAVREPAQVSDALTPIIGQSVRKAVASAFAAILERVNQALQHTLSLRSMRWRLEAARTGRPFAEIVLLHSLVYRVEQVFLVHRRTGILLAHATAATEDASRDPDQIAAMLNVIQKFVHDAFREGETLTRFEVGDLQGRSEIGAEATITAVVRGTPPEDLCRVLREALDKIQREHRQALLAFRGDTAPFASVEEVLAGCLVERRVERRKSPILPIVAGVILLALLAFVGRAIVHARDMRHRLDEYAAVLRAQPGIILTDATRDGDKLLFVGMRDPVAPDPATVLSARGLDPSRATLRLEPYYSPDPRLVPARFKAALSPPEGIGLAFDAGTVRVSGIAPREWLLRARIAGSVLPGVTSVDTSRAHEREAVDDLRAARERIEQATFGFPTSGAKLDDGDAARLDALARDAALVSKNAAAAGVSARFRVEGSADPAGSSDKNRVLSKERAAALEAALVARGVPAASIEARGDGASVDVPPAHARRAVVQVVVEALP